MSKGLIDDLREALVRDGKLAPSLDKLLGRYEYRIIGGSQKFWDISYIEATGMYEARWGRIGSAGKTTGYTGEQALQKIQEKIGKGYRLVDRPSRKSVDATDFDFMKELKKV